ncbi:TIGR03749 family integrating conjugative element protein [Vibrio tubiashii]|uniref:DUF3438 family protein n=1 Tax=Vibrio tubiashii TaxID=29498 RepID=UPI001EFD4FE8|nr:DUF3438 family protein [Vibrio tubiashii]MCG9576705.1 TIGR03749 family integrating conjugative element protein [Vibrio tubiashii]
MNRIYTTVLALIALAFPFHSSAVEVQVYKGEPIDIVLEVGKQRIIVLDEHVNISVPKSITNKVEIESANGSVYITAKERFDKTPARITLRTSKVMIRASLQATAPTDVPTEMMKIVVHKPKSAPSGVQASSTVVPPFMKAKQLTAVDLMRFAHQSYWVPARLRPALPSGVSPVRIAKGYDLSALMTHCSLGIFDFEVIHGFKTRDGRYLTTIKVTNKTPNKRYLNLTHWNTQALFVSPYHLYLGAKGTTSELTTLAVITSMPFGQAINSRPQVFNEFGMNEGCL